MTLPKIKDDHENVNKCIKKCFIKWVPIYQMDFMDIITGHKL